MLAGVRQPCTVTALPSQLRWAALGEGGCKLCALGHRVLAVGQLRAPSCAGPRVARAPHVPCPGICCFLPSLVCRLPARGFLQQRLLSSFCVYSALLPYPAPTSRRPHQDLRLSKELPRSFSSSHGHGRLSQQHG